MFGSGFAWVVLFLQAMPAVQGKSKNPPLTWGVSLCILRGQADDGVGEGVLELIPGNHGAYPAQGSSSLQFNLKFLGKILLFPAISLTRR